MTGVPREHAERLARWIEAQKRDDHRDWQYDPRPDIEAVLSELDQARASLKYERERATSYARVAARLCDCEDCGEARNAVLSGLCDAAEQYMDTGRGDLDGWISQARAALAGSDADGDET